MGSKIKKCPKVRSRVESPREPGQLFAAGRVLLDDGRQAEAAQLLRTAIQAQPSSAQALNRLANFLAKAARKEEARSLVEGAFDKNDHSAQKQLSRGIAYSEIGDYETALELLADARALDASLHLPVLLMRGDIYRQQEKWDWTVQMTDAILEKAPKNLDALRLKESCLSLLSDTAAEVAVSRRILEIAPDVGVHSRMAFNLPYLADSTAESVYEEGCRWFALYGAELKTEIRPPGNTPDPKRKLKIGYVSSDLRRHPMMRLLPAVFHCHDEVNFDIKFYSVSSEKDGLTEYLASTLKHFIPLEAKKEEIAARVRADGIDILVDLSGHTMPASAHLAFAMKPAPVQVSWLGVVGTTGMPAMDYFLGDAYAPCPGTEQFFSETVYRLPRIGCAYRPRADVGIAESPFFKNGYITFGCFNDPHKITRELIKLWSVILHMTPGSRMFLKFRRLEKPIVQARLREAFVEDGISAERICFAGASPDLEYLLSWGEVDIALDPYPYNGGTTTMDALWMGVPVVTLAGRMAVSCCGASILSSLGLPVAYSAEQYIQNAMFLVENIPKTPGIRRGVRQAMLNSALMDEKGLVHALEMAYRDMWAKWCESQ